MTTLECDLNKKEMGLKGQFLAQRRFEGIMASQEYVSIWTNAEFAKAVHPTNLFRSSIWTGAKYGPIISATVCHYVYMFEAK